jgi:hypothetical protein
VVQERHAHLKAEGHAGPVDLCEDVLGEVSLHVDILDPIQGHCIGRAREVEVAQRIVGGVVPQGAQKLRPQKAPGPHIAHVPLEAKPHGALHREPEKPHHCLRSVRDRGRMARYEPRTDGPCQGRQVAGISRARCLAVLPVSAEELVPPVAAKSHGDVVPRKTAELEGGKDRGVGKGFVVK